jgi:hypothetical protein
MPCRHQWYQLGSKVVVDVYAKSLPKDAVTAQLEGSSSDKLRITIKAQPASSSSSGGQQQQLPAAAAADDEDYVLELDLFEKVASEPPVKVEVLRTKVEITMVKVRGCLLKERKRLAVGLSCVEESDVFKVDSWTLGCKVSKMEWVVGLGWVLWGCVHGGSRWVSE